VNKLILNILFAFVNHQCSVTTKLTILCEERTSWLNIVTGIVLQRKPISWELKRWGMLYWWAVGGQHSWYASLFVSSQARIGSQQFILSTTGRWMKMVQDISVLLYRSNLQYITRCIFLSHKITILVPPLCCCRNNLKGSCLSDFARCQVY